MRRLHVAVAQIQTIAGDVAGNLARLERQVRCAAIVGVEVILFAEAVAQGYDLSPEDLALAVPLDGALGRRLSELAATHHLARKGPLLRAGERPHLQQPARRLA